MSRIPRSLRNRKSKARTETAEPEKKPEGYRHSQTDGWSSVERAPRRYYEAERTGFYNPIVFGFRPNEER